FAVKHNGNTAVFVECGLLACDEIDDGKASHSERDARRNEQSFGIRPAMDHALAHGVQQVLSAFGSKRSRIKIGPSSYSTHCVLSAVPAQDTENPKLAVLFYHVNMEHLALHDIYRRALLQSSFRKYFANPFDVGWIRLLKFMNS